MSILQRPGFAIPIDGHVLVFALLVALISGLAFGLAPAWLASRTPASESLKEGSRGSTAGPSSQRLKAALIIGEIAAALVLVGVAHLVRVAVKKFLHRDVGWNTEGLFTGNIALPWNRYTDDARCRDFHRTLLDRLSALPGADHAPRSPTACRSTLIIYGRNLVAAGQAPVPRGQEPLAQTPVSPELLRHAADPA